MVRIAHPFTDTLSCMHASNLFAQIPYLTCRILMISRAISSPVIDFASIWNLISLCLSCLSETKCSTTAKASPSFVVPSKITDTHLSLNSSWIFCCSWLWINGIIPQVSVSLYACSSSSYTGTLVLLMVFQPSEKLLQPLHDTISELQASFLLLDLSQSDSTTVLSAICCLFLATLLVLCFNDVIWFLIILWYLL